MGEKVHGPGVALDFNKLLGFKRLAGIADNRACLARVLGDTYNKLGEFQHPSERQLAKALGAACNKVGENPRRQG